MSNVTPMPGRMQAHQLEAHPHRVHLEQHNFGQGLPGPRSLAPVDPASGHGLSVVHGRVNMVRLRDELYEANLDGVDVDLQHSMAGQYIVNTRRGPAAYLAILLFEFLVCGLHSLNSDHGVSEILRSERSTLHVEILLLESRDL